MTRFERATRDTFSALSAYNYRLFFFGQLVSVSGTWMQSIAQAWLVLELSGSGALLGLVTACQFLPMLVLGPFAGVVADRVDTRRLLVLTQSLAATLALVLGALTVTGAVRLWMVFVLALGLGLVNAFDMPGRQTFVLEMVGRDRLTNAVSLNSIVMNTGRLLGPAVAGAVIAAWGLGVCFVANGISYLAAIVALLVMRPHELLVGPKSERRRGQLAEGLRYVWSTPALRVPLLLMIAIGTLTYEFQVSLPLLAKDTFGTGAAGYGLLQSAMSLGAIVGGLGLAARARPTHRRLGLAAVGFGVATGALALAPSYGTALLLLVVVGAASILFITLANSTLQPTADPAMRSRVIALYGVAFLGSTPIGGPIVGWVGQVLGPRWGLALGAAAALIAAAACWRSLVRQHVLEPATVGAAAEELEPTALDEGGPAPTPTPAPAPVAP